MEGSVPLKEVFIYLQSREEGTHRAMQGHTGRRKKEANAGTSL